VKTVSAGAVLVLAALAAAGCEKKSSIEQLTKPEETNSSDPVKLAVTVEKPTVALGDDVVFHFKLTNTGAAPVQVNVPRIDQRSVTMRVRRADGTVAMLSRNYATLGMTGGQQPQFVYEQAEAKTLAPGASLEHDVSTVAVEAGKFAFTPSYVRVGSAEALVAPTVDVEVKPADPAKPRLGVVIDTTLGAYTAAFRPDVAYNTVECFASRVKKGYYTGLKFHRIMRGFMAQGGDAKGTGDGEPGFYVPFEARPDKLPHKRGVMSMARTGIPGIGRDTAGSQFFIMFATRPDLDQGGYTTFAEMADGDATLTALENVPTGRVASDPQASPPLTPIVIKSAKLVDVK